MAPSKALVVEDQRPLADRIVEELRAGVPDLVCRMATTGADACAATESDLDVALVDLHLPDADGVELIGDLRERAPFVQVVIVTGDASIESAIGAIDRGAFSYVLKPFSTNELLEKVARAIERAHLLREHHALELKLEQSERRHRNMLESVPAFVVALDGHGNVALWNRQLEQVTGFSRDEMIGERGVGLIGGVDRDLRLPLKRGGHRLVRWRRSEVTVSPNEPPLTFAVGVDVTEEREAQRHAARTERLVAMGTLAAGLAHEVRNPLNSASLQLQVIERRLARGDARPDAIQNGVNIVHNEIRRLDRLVSEFLAFARPMPLNLRPVALNDILAGVVHLVRPECETAGVALENALEPTVGRIHADEERLRQVFLNIVRNGIEAMEGGGRLVVSSHGADVRGFVRVEVEDTGPGFPETAPIFDAFYTTKERGTGLGLSLVHSIISEHGGSIQVESRPGRTLFSVSLPQPSS